MRSKLQVDVSQYSQYLNYVQNFSSTEQARAKNICASQKKIRQLKPATPLPSVRRRDPNNLTPSGGKFWNKIKSPHYIRI